MYLGCRHGLVLIFNISKNQMLAWDPVTGDQHRLAVPLGTAEKIAFNGAVLRVGDGHFQVVLAAADNDDKQHRRALACVYSSETGLWGDLISTPLPSEVPVSRHPIDMSGAPILVYTGKPNVLVGDSIYWLLVGYFVGILEFNLVKQSLDVIWVPVHMLEQGHHDSWIMRAEGGGLGLLFHLDTRFQLWKRTTDSDGAASWGLERTIDLDKLVSLNSLTAILLGYAEGNNVVLVWIDGILFLVHLESLQLKKLFETDFLPHYHPFESVYTAGIGDEHDAADLLHNAEDDSPVNNAM